jgi:hypothetical protein
MEYLIYNLRYNTDLDSNLSAIISTDSMERAKSMLEEYLKSIHTERGFKAEFIINTGFYSNREGIILFR